MTTLFTNIGRLLQIRDISIRFVAGQAMSELPSLDDAFLSVEEGRIGAFGKMQDCPPAKAADQVVDVKGQMILPSWCDSHTHLVYAGSRETEFVDRIHGLDYQEIARRGGGILNSAKRLEETAEEDLYEQSANRLEEVMRLGTGAIEIKSGYGLTRDAELKMLRVIRRLSECYSIPIKATFLGAHAVPSTFGGDTRRYLDMLIEDVLPVIKAEGLADFVDIFCEKGYFTIDDTDYLLTKAADFGLIPKIHVNQFTALGGVGVGVRHRALSVDHLEVMTEEDIEVLQGTSTMPVALPGCSFFLGIPYTPARDLIDRGLPLALATDYNPGSAPSGNMNFVVSTACIKMKMTPEEAVNAATLNGAYAMGIEHEVGSITVGKWANLIMTRPMPSVAHLPYAFGSSPVDRLWIKGEEI